MNIVFFSALSYNSVIGGRTKILADILAQRGHNVHFVEMPSLRRPYPWPCCTTQNGLTIHHVPPLVKGWFMMNSIIGRLWCKVVAGHLRRTLPQDCHGIVSTPFWSTLLEQCQLSDISYDCLDHVSIHAPVGGEKIVVKAEERLINQARRIFTVSQPLIEVVEKQTDKPVYLLTNGVPEAWLERPAVRPDKPVAGFLGALYEWVDYELILKCAKHFKNVEFRLIGPVRDEESIAKLKELPNVSWHPAVPFTQVPGCMEQFSVGLIPFLPDLIGTLCNPIKLYEYTALGKPVVTTILGDERLGIKVATSHEEFIKELGQYLDTPPKVEELRAKVREYTWEKTAQKLEELL